MKTLWLVLAVGVLIGLGVATGFELLFRISYVLVGVVVLSYLWARFSVRSLQVTRKINSQRAQVGEQLIEKLTATNGSLLPKLWVEIRDHSTLPGHQVSQVVSLGKGDSKTWSAKTTCVRRGEYRLGPVVLSGGDPFGFYRVSRRLGQSRSVLVYPQTVPLPYFRLRLGEVTGGATQRSSVQYITPSVAGIREYAPGDSFNRIHWPTTAKWDQLMVKEFDLEPFTDTWLILDMEKGRHFGLGDDSTEELAVKTAASLCHRLLDMSLTVGLLAYGPHAQVVMPDRGNRQLWKLLEQLAVTKATGRVPLVELILAEAGRFSKRTTIVVVTPSPSTDWVAAVASLAGTGVKAVAVLVDPRSFGGGVELGPVLEALVNERAPIFIVRSGVPLAEALAGDGGSLETTLSEENLQAHYVGA